MLDAIVGFKSQQAAAKQARIIGDYNAKIAENEAVLLRRQKADEEANLRQNSERLIATQRVATAASGVQMSGSPMQAIADAYFNTELDALRVQYAGDIAEAAKISEANLARAGGRARSQAYKMQSYQTLLEGAEKFAKRL
ncbi:MAG: hypothetical protein VW496_01640 [Pelagibacteraceae bacterium]